MWGQHRVVPARGARLRRDGARIQTQLLAEDHDLQRLVVLTARDRVQQIKE
jgi:hypothetical protein